MTARSLIEQQLQPIDREYDPVLTDLLKLIQQQYDSSLAAVLIYG